MSRRSDRFINIVEYSEDNKDTLNKFQEQLEMVNLIGTEEVQWSMTITSQCVNEMRKLWNGWLH